MLRPLISRDVTSDSTTALGSFQFVFSHLLHRCVTLVCCCPEVLYCDFPQSVETVAMHILEDITVRS
jgi:hypothetical protein